MRPSLFVRRSGPRETPFPGRPRAKAAGGTGAAALAASDPVSFGSEVAMASFVTEVLAHSGRLEKEDLGTRISRLTQRVEEIKVKPGQRAADSKGTEGGARVGLSLWGEEGA